MSPLRALGLSVMLLAALGLGALLPGHPIGQPVITTALFVATLLSVGGLEAGWHSRQVNYTGAASLLTVSLLAGTLPVLLAAASFGISSPAGIGLALVGIVPTAAGLPAYASAIQVPGPRIALFCLMSYGIGVVVTPVLSGALLGSKAGLGPLLWVFPVGLMLPSVLGIGFGRLIRRVPSGLRRAVTLSSILVIMVALGGSTDVRGVSGALGSAGFLALVVVSLARAPVCGALGGVVGKSLARGASASEAVLAGGYKNCALAGAIALAAGRPEASVPAVLGLISEMLLLAALAGVVVISRPKVQLTATRGARRD